MTFLLIIALLMGIIVITDGSLIVYDPILSKVYYGAIFVTVSMSTIVFAVGLIITKWEALMSL